MTRTHDTLRDLFGDVADAIREKDGSSSDIIADEFPTRIRAIPVGGDAEPLTVTKNGTTYSRSGGYNPVTVDVPEATYTIENDHIVDGKWVRPAEYPNLESLPITDEDGTVYLTYDTDGFSWISLKYQTTGSAYRQLYELGYVQNGVFTVVYTNEIAYSGQYTYMFTDADKLLSRYWVLRVSGRIKTPSLPSWSYTNPGSTTARALAGANQKIVERYGTMPYATTLSISNTRIESDYIIQTGALTSMASCYASCRNLIRIKRGTWNMANVTSYASCFSECRLLIDIDTDFSGWVTSKCTTLSSMFKNCENIHGEIDCSDWDTSKVTTISGLFYFCRNITRIIGIEDLYFPKVTTVYGSSAMLFSNCTSLTGELDLRGWMIGSDATVKQSFQSMFTYCRKVTKIDISTWDMTDATSMASMFAYCESCEEIKLPDDIGSNQFLTTVASAFTYCYSLKKVDMSKIEMSMVTNIASVCSYCLNLEEFIPPTTEPLGSASTSSATTPFTYCTSLEELDLSWYDCSKWTYSTVQYAGLITGSNQLKDVVPPKSPSKAFEFSAGSLSRESLVALFNQLGTVTGTVKLTISTTNLAKLTDTDIAIATGKGWTLA